MRFVTSMSANPMSLGSSSPVSSKGIFLPLVAAKARIAATMASMFDLASVSFSHISPRSKNAGPGRTESGWSRSSGRWRRGACSVRITSWMAALFEVGGSSIRKPVSTEAIDQS